MPLMGFREYARHRAANQLAGGTLAAVQRAIKSGRIQEAVVKVTGQPDKIDSARADQLWTERSAPRVDDKPGVSHEIDTSQKGTPAPATVNGRGAGAEADDAEDLAEASYAEARAARERANARKAQLEVDVLEGRLVDTERAAAAWEKVIQESRTKVLALPSKIRTRLPHLTAPQVSLIEQLVRDTLTELSEGMVYA